MMEYPRDATYNLYVSMLKTHKITNYTIDYLYNANRTKMKREEKFKNLNADQKKVVLEVHKRCVNRMISKFKREDARIRKQMMESELIRKTKVSNIKGK